MSADYPLGCHLESRAYKIMESDAEEGWLTHMLVASFSRFSSDIGASSASEAHNAIAIANLAENQLPYAIDEKAQTASVHGIESDIEYVAKLMDIRGFNLEK